MVVLLESSGRYVKINCEAKAFGGLSERISHGG